MSFSMPRSQIAAIAPNSAKGTASSTPIGSVHFSYCAARIRNTITSAKANTRPAVEPAFFSSYDWPDHA